MSSQKEGEDMRVLSLVVICIVLSVASLAWGGNDERVNMAPDGSYVGGKPVMTPAGDYVGTDGTD